MGPAMGRSFGDSIVHGVSCVLLVHQRICSQTWECQVKSEISNRRLGSNDSSNTHSATDGVWDVIDNNQTVKIVVEPTGSSIEGNHPTQAY